MLRRALLIVLVLVWLFIMLLPTLAFVLVRNGQVQVGSPDGRHVRLFLLQDASAEGLGLERARTVQAPADAPPSTSCLRTSVHFWLWSGEEASGATYCQCIDQTTGQALPITPPACRTP